MNDREISTRPVHAKDVPEGLDGVSPSAFRRRTVEVAVARLHEGRVGSGAVEAREVMDHRKVRAGGIETKDGADPIPATGGRRPVENSVSDDERRLRAHTIRQHEVVNDAEIRTSDADAEDRSGVCRATLGGRPVQVPAELDERFERQSAVESAEVTERAEPAEGVHREDRSQIVQAAPSGHAVEHFARGGAGHE